MNDNRNGEFHYIHLIGGEKGGVGKTFACRAFAEYLTRKEKLFVLVEADSQIEDVGPIYQEQAVELHTLALSDDPTKATDPDVIFKAAMQAPVIVNLPSNTRLVLQKWIERVNLLDFMQSRYGGQYLIQWFVTDGCSESIKQLKASIEAFEGRIPHIVILNEGRLNGANFDYLDNSLVYQSIKQRPNFVTEVLLPPLENSIQFAIDENEWTFEKAEKCIEEEEGYSVLDTQRIITFVRGYTETFDRALEQLDVRLREWGNQTASTDSSGNGAEETEDGAGKQSVVQQKTS